MIGIRSICVIAFGAAGCQALAADHPVKPQTDAVYVCESGKPSPRHEHPSAACWSAYSEGLEQRQYVEAIKAVRTGCQKYRRSDMCLFVAELKLPSPGVMPVGRSPGRRETIEALRAADAALSTWEIEDGEDGVLRRDRPLVTAPAQAQKRQKQ